MNVKMEDRFIAIKEIIANNNISSQDELLSKLNQKGFELTQATLSRDLKHLKIGRIPSEKGVKYVLSNEIVNSYDITNNPAVAIGFTSIMFSGNIAVIKTLPAYSHTIADFIDKADINEIIGTIAGDDTVIAIIREGIKQNQVTESILNTIPELKSKIKLLI